MRTLKLCSIVFLALNLIACNRSSDTEETTMETPLADEPNSLIGSYSFQNANDTILLDITNAGNPVIGDLIISLKEKDRNVGTFNGLLQDSILVAEYTFKSEGATSIREVAFKIKPDTIWLGYGDMEEKAGKTVFLDRQSLNFDAGMPLIRK